MIVNEDSIFFSTTEASGVIADEMDMHINNTSFQNFTGNKTDQDSFDFGWKTYLQLGIFVPIVILAIFGNLLALWAFFTRGRQMQSPTHYFIANLAFADFLVGVLCLPLLTYQTVTGKWPFGPELCFAYSLMHFWFCATSIYSTCAICVERYIGVRYPLSSSRIMSLRRVKWIIFVIWLYGGAIAFAAILAFPEEEQCDDATVKEECRSKEGLIHVIFSTVLIMYIPTVIMTVLYWRIYVLATRHLSVLRQGFKKMSNYSNGSGKRKSKRLSSTLSTSSYIVDNGTTVTTTNNDSNSATNSDQAPQESLEMTSGGSGGVGRLSIANLLRAPSPTNSNATGYDTTSRETLVQATSSKKHIYLAKRLLLLVGILLLSYVPYYTLFLLKAVLPGLVPKEVFSIFKWVRYFNSAVNPFLYAFAVPAYRKAFANIVCRGKLF